MWSDLVPHHVRLRITVKQQERWTFAANQNVDARAARLDAVPGEAFEHAAFPSFSRSSDIAPMTTAYVNRIATAVPGFDVHRKFVEYAPRLLGDGRTRRLFARMAERAEIEHRYSFFEPHPDPERLDAGGFFRRGNFPDTA